MLVRLIAVDRIRTPYVAAACDEFRTRLARYYGWRDIDVRAGDGTDPDAAMRVEGERILKHVRDDDRLWLLDRDGEQLASVDLARRIRAIESDGTQRLTLVVGGAFGIAPALRARAEFVWSLSKLTFLHEWARAIVLEQFYRAAKIARNEPYHY